MKCFINITNDNTVLNCSSDHSEFQDIVALNIPYCDEYIIFADSDLFGDIKKQLNCFQCLPYKLIDSSGKSKKNVFLSGCKVIDNSDKVFVIDSCFFDIISGVAESSPDEYKNLIIKVKKQLYTSDCIFVCGVDIIAFNCDKVKCEPSVLDNPEKIDFDVSKSSENISKTTYEQTETMIKLTPAFKDYLWGGIKLRDIYHKPCDYDIIAESWELSAHEAGQSIVASGKHKGQKFGDYLDAVGMDVLGWKCSLLQSFPLLIKFIDAKGNLSVQVHPDDDYALEHENQYGKNEMWYVIDSEPGAGLYVGFNRDVSRKEVEERVKNNTIMEVLNFYPTNPGDVFFIPAGTVHAIGAGNFICEIQQSSNCTYRLYDYDRRDKLGNPRELHLEEALNVLCFNQYKNQKPEVQLSSYNNVLASCKYFEVEWVHVNKEIFVSVGKESFQALVCIDGSGQLQALENNRLKISFCKGETIFIHAGIEKYLIVGDAELIKVWC